MKIVVSGMSEYGKSSTLGEEVDCKWFDPYYVEIYDGEPGEETLKFIYVIDKAEEIKKPEDK